jgi:hypothetical protein
MDNPFSSLLPANFGGSDVKATKGGIERRRQLAETMMRGAYDTSPVQHWTQGAARVAQALAGGMQNRRADAMEAERNQALMQALSGNLDPQTMVRIGAEYEMPTLLQGGAQAMLQERRQAQPNYQIYQGGFIDQENPQAGWQPIPGAPAAQEAQDTTRTSLTPILGNDGNYYLPRTDGSSVQIKPPEGVQLNGPQDKAAAAVLGKAQAEAQTKQSVAVQTGGTALQLIERMKTHPGLDGAVGNVYGRLPDIALFGEARNFEAMRKQVTGGAFLEAYKTLQGSGQITEIEGAKATEAIARMDRAQTKDGFLQALDDYEAVIRAGMDRAQRQAQGDFSVTAPGAPPQAPAPEAPQPAAPEVSKVINGKTYVKRDGQWYEVE